MLKRIISGGQTGADRAALDAALELDFPCGGSCPVGRMAEDGAIDARYPLSEVGGGYRKRTKQNVLDADATVLFYSRYVSGGTETTLALCIKQDKPYKLIDIEVVDEAQAAKLIRGLIDDFDVSVMNIAGPRESQCEGIYDFVKVSVMQLLKKERPRIR